MADTELHNYASKVNGLECVFNVASNACYKRSKCQGRAHMKVANIIHEI